MTISQRQIPRASRLDAILEAGKYGLVTFAGIVGVLGIVLSYAPDDVIFTLYYAGVVCAAVSGLGKWISIRIQP